MENGGTNTHLWGRERRYMLTEMLWENGPMTVAQLAVALTADGWRVGGRPSKTISDALRWEIEHGRVVRLSRGLYGPGRMPKQTRSWIRNRNRRTRAEAAAEAAAQLAGPRCHVEPASPGSHHAVPEIVRHARRHDSTSPDRAPSDATDPAPAQTSSKRRQPTGDEVVVIGGGWSDDDDAADEALRQQLLQRYSG